MLILTPEVLTLFILNALFFLFASVAFILSLKIHFYYDKNETTPLQYRLEKQSYLGSTIIKFIFIIKVPLFLFFIATLENISSILPGAMCSVGVVNATDYGVYLLILKLLNLYLFAYWIVLSREDMKRESAPYMKLKFQLFIVLYLFLLAEIILETLMFFSIDMQDIVDCCGAVFSASDGSYMAAIIGSSPLVQIALFYGVFALLLIAYKRRQKRFFAIINGVFIFVSLTTLIGFFGTYIYELPTHHCPFCFLSHDYNYVGYFLYIFLFLGTFWGMALGLIRFGAQEQKRYFKLSLFFNAAYALLVSLYVLIYYAKNSVLL